MYLPMVVRIAVLLSQIYYLSPVYGNCRCA